ncbi:MAG: hypothetical protein HZC16_02700 [Candidatus Omnitrophica bacterium]|nr:hypothetical protein [Candidatus Omnitrophota bacterium]
MKYYYEHIGSFIFYLILSTIVFSSILSNSGTIGLHHDWNIPPLPKQITSWFDSFSYGWTEEGLGGSMIQTLYITFPLAVIASLGFGGEIITKGFLLLCFSLSGFSLYYFCRKSNLDAYASLFAGAFYAFTPVLLNRTIAGHIGFMFTYAVLPLTFYFFTAAVHAVNWKEKTKNALFCFLFYIFAGGQFQFMFLIPITLFLYLLFYSMQQKNAKEFVRNLFLFFIISLFFIAAFAPVLLPRLTFASETLSFGAFYSYGMPKMEYASVFRSLTLQGYMVQYFEDGIKLNSLDYWNIIAFVITVFIFSSIFFIKKDSCLKMQCLSWTAIASLFVFFNSGLSSSLSVMFWSFLYFNVRFFVAMLGEFYNLATIAAVAYAFLFGVFLDGALKKIKSHQYRIAFCAILLIVLFLYAFPSRVIYSKLLNTYTTDPSYSIVFDKLSNENGLFRVLWIPSINEFYTQFSSSSRQGASGSDPFMHYSPKPTFPQWYSAFVSHIYPGGAWANTVFNVFNIYKYNTKYAGDLFYPSAVKYFLIRDDVSSGFLPPNNFAQSTLSLQKDIHFKEKIGNITIFENDKANEFIYPASQKEASLIAGDFSTLVSLSYFANENPDLINRQKVFFFSPQLSPEDISLLNKTNVNIIIDKHLDDLTFSLIPRKDRIFLQSEFQAGGWDYSYRDLAQWEVVAQTHGPVIVRSGETVKLRLNLKNNDYELWLKTFFSPSSQGLTIKLDNSTVGQSITSHTSYGHFKWVKIKLENINSSVHSLELTAKGTEFIDAIAITPRTTAKEAIESAREMVSEKNVLILRETEEFDTSNNGWETTSILGVFNSQGYSIQSAQSNFAGFTQYETFIPKDDNYTIGIRLWSPNAPSKLKLAFNYREDKTRSRSLYFEQNASPDFEWSVEEAYLKKGVYNVYLTSNTSGVFADLFAITNMKKSSEPEIKLNKTTENPTSYVMESNSIEPFFIVHAVNYRIESWNLSNASGFEMPSIVANGFASAYLVTPTHEKLHLYLATQSLFELGAMIRNISFTITILGLIYFAINWWKNA